MGFVNRWGRIMACNPALGGILECPHHELLDETLDAFVDREDAARYQEFLERFTRGDPKADYYHEGRFRTRPGRQAWWSLQFSEISPSGDGLYLVIVQDITLKKIYEEELKEAHEMAERANSAKSQFLANMTHEIRTPIHTIIGMTELLVQTRLTEEQSDYVKQVSAAADALINLVEDVLDFSKIEAGRMTLELTACRLDQILMQALDLVAAKAYAKGLEIAVSFQPALFDTVQVDPLRLRQIVVNLLTNSVKFTHRGGIRLRGWVEEPAEGDSTWFIQVEDTGIGIEQSKIPHLFQPFYQADDSHTRQYGGTGLGLTICQQLARMMGGDITVQSEVGKGSVFTLHLRLRRVGQSSDLEMWKNLFRGKRLLVAEAAAMECEALVELLTSWGCTVESCVTGRRLLHVLAQDSARDAVFLSDSIGDHDVWSLAEVIHSMRNASPLPLLLCTTPVHHLEISRKKAERRFSGYLVRPYVPQAVASELLRALSGEPLAPVSSTVMDRHGNIHLLRGHRVLVAEDHEVNRALFKLLLEQLGAEVHLAVNGKEAVERFEPGAHHLVFLDLQMPEMNGFEAARRIRGRDGEVPIVGVSASAVKSEIERAQQAGMNDFLTKPFKRQDLLQLLERLRFLEEAPQTERPPPPEARNHSFDPQEALDTFLNRTEVLRRVLQGFLQKGEETLQALRTALDAGDIEACFKLGHSLKGAARNVSAWHLGELAARIEEMARSGTSVPQMEPVFMHLVHEWQRFRLEAEQWLERSGH